MKAGKQDRDYVMKVAAHYAKEPTIAWWQLVNEPDGRNLDGSCDEKAATDALRWFADDVTGAIKSVDPNHMVDLGSISWCGQQGTDFQYVNAGAVDLCDSYHDYSNATNAFVSKGHLVAVPHEIYLFSCIYISSIVCILIIDLLLRFLER